MSPKRQPSKQRRQTQNQKQRAALAARREAAAAAQAADRSTGGGSTARRGSVLSRLRGAQGTGRATAATGAVGNTGAVPVGQRAALSALFAAIAAAVVGSFVFPVPVDRGGEVIMTRGALVAEWAGTALEAAQDAPGDDPAEIARSVDDWSPGSDPYGKARWPISASALLPVIGTGLGVRAVTRRSSAKLVNRTMYVTLFGALLASQLLLVFLPAVIALGVAAFQVRKAEVAAARAAAPAVDEEGVIDVDEAEVLEAEVVDADEPLDGDEDRDPDEDDPR